MPTGERFLAFMEADTPDGFSGKMEPLTPLVLATAFHDTYERLAPAHGYETRVETRNFDASSPNGKLMIAVCGEILARLSVVYDWLEEQNAPDPDAYAARLEREADEIAQRHEDRYIEPDLSK